LCFEEREKENAMGNRRPCLFLVFLVTLSRFVAQSHGVKNQGEALDNLYRAKFSRDYSIDTRPFEVIDTNQFEEMNTLLGKSKCHPRKEGSKEKDRIKRLPGQPHVRFSQYGGYITVNKTAGAAFYYYFVEADKHSKEHLPLLLWLNGGSLLLPLFIKALSIFIFEIRQSYSKCHNVSHKEF
jgi:serine carboxypeptidase-like clade 2